MNLTCRAELLGSPSREQYDRFHALMSGLELERTISRGGKLYRLPTAEYLSVNASSSLHLLALQITKAALDVTGHPCKLTLTPVADVNDIVIAGLEEVQDYATQLSYYWASLLSGQASSRLQQPHYPALEALRVAIERA